MKTIAQILKKCSVGDKLSDGKNFWVVTELNFDGAIVASPINSDGSKCSGGFELWSEGVESISIIPNLHKIR